MQMNANTQAPLTLAGDRSTGQPVRSSNVLACNTIANYVKSSLGPVGLDKMLVDDVGEVTITNDGATILKLSISKTLQQKFSLSARNFKTEKSVMVQHRWCF